MNSDEIMQSIPAYVQCETCKAYTYEKDNYPAHAPDCPAMPIETARGELIRYHAAYLKIVQDGQAEVHKNTKHAHHEKIRARERAVMWQGKYAILKLENNALRKKLKP